MLKQCLVKLCGVLTCLFPFLASANPVQSDHIEVELVAEVVSVQPGQPFWVGLRLATDEHWKTYWRNPGDAGLPTRIEWRLPEGLNAGDIQWPYPERFAAQGVVSYGYDREVLLLTEIQPAGEIQSGTTLPLDATASWLVCDDVCIPGSAELSLALPVENAPPTPNSRWAPRFAETRNQLPQPLTDGKAGFTFQEERLHLQVQTSTPLFTDASEVTFFPGKRSLVAHTADQETEWTAHRLYLEQPQSALLNTVPDTLEGVLVIKTPQTILPYSLTATPGLPVVSDTAVTSEQSPAAIPDKLFYAMLLALGGGLLLNLMPCVFPVLSLKAIGLMESVHISHHAQRLHGIAYTLGVIMFFCGVAGILYLLKLGGISAGWGFQLQAPWFVALLAYLLFILGLSFSGLLELGSRFMGVGESLTHRGGYVGSFFTGALAAVVASPCTAPFMGTAIAFAITQPPLYSLLVFFSLGLGMASPFLVVAFVPRLGHILPKPGPWMNTFKQAMAFPLYLTSIWLLWVLGRQTDVTGMTAVLVGMVLIFFAVWLRHLKPQPKGRWGQANTALAATAFLAALAILITPPLQAPADANTAKTATREGFWEPYSPERLAELRAEGRPVFVNMTADWCISCIANERVALSFPTVRETFKEKGIVPLKGDWTNGNPEITQVLENFGRSGVPLYIFYPASPADKPKVLPQWLSPMNVLDALENP